MAHSNPARALVAEDEAFICTCINCKRCENGIKYTLRGVEHFGLRSNRLRNAWRHTCWKGVIKQLKPLLGGKKRWGVVCATLVLKGMAKVVKIAREESSLLCTVQETVDENESLKRSRQILERFVSKFPEYAELVDNVVRGVPPKPHESEDSSLR